MISKKNKPNSFKSKESNKKTLKRKNKEKKNDEESEIENEKNSIDFNLPKPGEHAKASEWRKWKMMKRAIREEREVKRLLKRQKLEKEQKENAEIHKNLLELKQSGRNFTLSIAIPGSIIGNVQSKELKTYVAGQIARAATLFCVDEIIIYNEYGIENNAQNEINEQLIKILEYLECPQYLRKALFPPHKYLEHVGLLNALEAPHHFRINDDWQYREGVVTDIPSKENKGSWIDIGLYNKIQVDKKLKPGVRVTVKKQEKSSGKQTGIIVSPETPRTEHGLYWGYQVRYASAFRKILFESSFKDGYDLKIGVNNKQLSFSHLNNLPRVNHYLIVFCGIQGIEAAIESDEKLKANKLEQVFSYVCQSDNSSEFGSRSIRLEESLLITLSFLRSKIIEAWSRPTTSNSLNESQIDSENEEEKFTDAVNEDDDENQGENDDKEEEDSQE